RIGDQIVLQTPGGNLEYMVSGFYEDDSEFNDIMDGCCVYMNPSGFGSVTSMNSEDVSPRFYIRFQKETGLRKTIGDLKQEYNLTDENVKENTAILALLGASSSSTTDGLYPLAALCFVIILAAGIFMIASCMKDRKSTRLNSSHVSISYAVFCLKKKKKEKQQKRKQKSKEQESARRK